ncbi:MAG: tetratricopeptide repeat protein [Nitrospinae bacterium]|nr:tetratricopeptide repeat protein [Nitrospinota bacterium]
MKIKKSVSIILFLIIILLSSPYVETASRLNEKGKESVSKPPAATSKPLPLPEVKIEKKSVRQAHDADKNKSQAEPSKLVPERFYQGEGTASQPASAVNPHTLTAWHSQQGVGVKVFEGREIYEEGLKLYQGEKHEEAIAKLTEFVEIYPGGKYGENALYLIADANYIISKKDETMYQSALDAYKTAASKFPKSHKREMALLRMGKLYEKRKLYIEAKASYQTLVNEYPKGKYAAQALIYKAEILIEEKKFKEAHKQLERVLVLYPFSTVVRDATFKIADSYFLEKDYIRAEELYREASQKWPTFPKANPLVMFNIGETYFINEKYKDARNIFFDLINLFPQNESAAHAMIRIGDAYYKEGRHTDAVLVYAEVISRFPESEDIYSIRMKMADAGIEQPNLVGASAIFDYTSYIEPMNTYQDVIVKNPSAPLVQEAMFKKGGVLSAENRYVEAIMTFKHLLTLYPDYKMAEEVKSAMRAAFFKIIDTYHSQKGFYTLLLTYYKNFDPFLKDIKDPKILFEIGDSYQQMGLYREN